LQNLAQLSLATKLSKASLNPAEDRPSFHESWGGCTSAAAGQRLELMRHFLVVPALKAKATVAFGQKRGPTDKITAVLPRLAVVDLQAVTVEERVQMYASAGATPKDAELYRFNLVLCMSAMPHDGMKYDWESVLVHEPVYEEEEFASNAANARKSVATLEAVNLLQDAIQDQLAQDGSEQQQAGATKRVRKHDPRMQYQPSQVTTLLQLSGQKLRTSDIETSFNGLDAFTSLLFLNLSNNQLADFGSLCLDSCTLLIKLDLRY
jgi:hypothetical protein